MRSSHCSVGSGRRAGPYRPPSIRAAARLVTTLFAVCVASAQEAQFPPAGIDAFDSAAQVTIELDSPRVVIEATLVGPTRIRRGSPFDPGDGLFEIDTEIVALELRVATEVGPVTIRSARPSPGKIKQRQPGAAFPADSFFDVFVEIQTPLGRLHNIEPIFLTAVIDEIPPFQARYMPEGTFQGVGLYSEDGVRVGLVRHVGHFVGEHPSFSVAPGGPSAILPGEIHDVPTAPRIPPEALGLTAGDDVDALSYGIDFIDSIVDVRFSVAPGAVGAPGSAVEREASRQPSEAHGDEFRVAPMMFIGGSNVQVLDETGDTAPPLPLRISDDVDALTEPPAVFVDRNLDGTPESPVYFSVATGSPSLAALGVDPADILMSSGGASPTVFLSRTELGLLPGDDIDALCLELPSRQVLYSLSPESPSLSTTTMPFSPADLFPFPIPGGTFFPAIFWFQLGLMVPDDLNAVKCALPEVDYYPEVQARIVIDGIPIDLAGEMTLHAAIGPDGIAIDARQDGLDRIPVTIVELDLVGQSPLGKISITNQPHEDGRLSFGDIVERTNVQQGRLDIQPFAPGGEGDSFFNVHFELTIDPAGLPPSPANQTTGVQVLRNGEPLRISSVIRFKPPGPGVTYSSSGPVPLTMPSGSPSGMRIDSFTLTPAAGPPDDLKAVFTPAGFVNAGSVAGPPSGGGLASLFGVYRDVSPGAAASIPLASTLNNVRVEYRSSGSALSVKASDSKQQSGIVLAPLLFVSDEQINLQVPWEVVDGSGTATAVVYVNGVPSDPVELPVAEFSPGIFTLDFGPGRAVVINVDASLAQPTGSVVGRTSRPARVGETVVIWATGLGPVDPPAVTGNNSFDENGVFVRRDTTTIPTVTIGGADAKVQFSGMSPEFVGVYQLNATVPEGAALGDAVPLVIEIGGVQSRADVTIAVQAAAGS